MYFDWTYLALVVPAIIFAVWASSKMNKTYRKYQNQQSMRRITGAQAARKILDANGLSSVSIDRITGNLTDNYDPTANGIRLSEVLSAAALTYVAALLERIR